MPMIEHLLKCLRRFRAKPDPAAETDVRLTKILQTPALITEPLSDGRTPDAPMGVHILGHDAHLLTALWTLKSFYRFSGANFPLTVHLQGRNTRQMLSTFVRHFPHARMITQEQADARVEPWLEARGLHRLLAMRRQFFLMMKLIDLRVLALTPLVLFFDSDVLFFRPPDELTTPPAELSTTPHLFMRDDYPSYCITPERAIEDLGVELIPFANTGIMRLVTDAIDLAACERFMAHPDLAVQHWHLEQTLHAMNASAQCRLRLLPTSYGMKEGLAARPDLVARHYTTPIRPLFMEEGVERLLQTGFIEALADLKNLAAANDSEGR